MNSLMKQLVSLLCVLTAAIAVSALSIERAQAVGFPTSGQFDQVNTISVPRMSVRIVQSISFKDGNIRLDSDDPNSFIPMTQIQTPDEVFVYCPLGTTGQKQVLTEKQPLLLDKMLADTKAKLLGATKVGTDTVEGYACDTYKMSQNNGQINIEFWVSTDPQFPFLLKTVETDSLLQKTTIVELQNIALNTNPDDSLFEVPAGIKFTVPAPPPAASSSATHSSGSSSSK
jgi:outer membrane lipoprotein-sorting protein